MTSLGLKPVSIILLYNLICLISAVHMGPTAYRDYSYGKRGSYGPPQDRTIHYGERERSSSPDFPRYDIGLECKGLFMCGVVGYGYYRRAECIDMMRVCDGIRDCKNGLDERSCPTDCHKIRKVPCMDKMTCANWCDGVKDCPTGEDEIRCTAVCGEGQYQCKGHHKWCISTDKFCNGFNDCPHYEDESVCGSSCPSGQYTCKDKTCIGNKQVCDGKNDCAQNDDEFNC